MKKARIDIQALRGVAVLFVVLYHANIPFIKAGYLGVDIFFVISGFLITKLIQTGIEAGTFKVLDFYFRRAKRILPAAYVTFFLTALLAPFFLAATEMHDFFSQMVGAVTYTINFVLWRQSGYFNGAADLKPLLHIWSLAIEEQYYLVLPALMLLVPRRLWCAISTAVLFASLILCVMLVGGKPNATFYLLPTRAWEFAIGSVGALAGVSLISGRLEKALFWPAVAGLILVPIFPMGKFHPGIDAFLVCLSTLVIIRRNHPLMERGMILTGLAKIGDISYSLYLVHWPLFAFLHNAWIGLEDNNPPISVRLGLIALSFLLAYLLTRYIETPIRYASIRPSRALVGSIVAASVALIAVTGGVAKATKPDKDFAYLARTNFGFAETCTAEGLFVARKECKDPGDPTILVWGDSYGMHLVAGLSATRGMESIVQATRSVCAPFWNMAPVERQAVTGRDEGWAKRCIEFNNSVIEYLAKTPSIKFVVLSSPFTTNLDKNYKILVKSGNAFHLTNPSAELAVSGITDTVKQIRALGKRVVIVAPTPQAGFDTGRCLARELSNLPIMGQPPNCQVPVISYQKIRAPVLNFLAKIPGAADVDVVGFDDYLCDSQYCKTYIDGHLIYRDGGHLSYDGSVYLAEQTKLISKIEMQAR